MNENISNENSEVKTYTENEQKVIAHEVSKDCKSKVKSVLLSYICTSEQNLNELESTANEILDEIFVNKQITLKVYDMKLRDEVLYEHGVTVATLSILTALMFNFTHDIVTSVGMGSFLHDIGLEAIDIDYTNKSLDDLSIDELFEYKKHTIHGFSVVENETWMPVLAKKIILQHHENVNGTGYPFRQKNAMVPVKIVSVCDGFVDRICGIGYPVMKNDEAIIDMQNNAGTIYDRRVLDIFLSFLSVYPTGTKVVTTDGDVAEVIGQNEYYTDKPIIKLIKNSNGKVFDRDYIVNLSDIRSVSIERSI